MRSCKILFITGIIALISMTGKAQHALPVYHTDARFAFPNKAGGWLHYQNWDPSSQGTHNRFAGQIYYSRGTNQLALQASQQKYIVDGRKYLGLSYSKTLPLSHKSMHNFVYLGLEAGYRMLEKNMPSLTRVNVPVQRSMAFSYSSLTTAFYTGLVYHGKLFANVVVHDLWRKSFGYDTEPFEELWLYGLVGYRFDIPGGFQVVPSVAFEYPVFEEFHLQHVHAELEIGWHQDGWNFAAIPVYAHDYKSGLLFGISPASWKLGMYFGLYYYNHSPYQEMVSTVAFQTP